MDYSVAVRSYRRVEVFKTHTYEILKRNNLLHKTTVFVNDEEDKQRYSILSDISIVVRDIPGGAYAFREICDYYPKNHPIMFFDDDIKEYFSFDAEFKLTRDATNLSEVLEEGFRLIKEHNLGSFSFLFSHNRLYVVRRPRIKFHTRFLQGCAFGCLNDKELIFCESKHDDSERTARFLKKYGGVLTFYRCGFVNKFGDTVEGGLGSSEFRQSSTRLEATKKEAERLLALHPEIFECVKYHKLYNWYDLKMYHHLRLVKRLKSLGVVVRKMSFN